MKDLSCAQEYAMTVSSQLRVRNTLEDQVELLDIFKRENLETAKESLRERPGLRSGFASV